jgi:predicted dehydrogenase
MTSLMLIGVGRHARRIHIPFLKKLRYSYEFDISAVLELDKTESVTNRFLKKNNFTNYKFIPVDKDDFTKKLSLKKSIRNKIINEIDKLGIDAAIISCDDKYHEAYIELCLEHNIHILMEKPLFTEDYASTNVSNAKKLIKKYESISELYKAALKKNNNLLFSIISQRRYHPAFNYIKNEVKSVFEKTNCPITHSKFYHSDGQWRMPDELLNESYHGYNRGIGKCSHSGYHFFDTLAQFMDIIVGNKKPDFVSAESTFIRPNDILEQNNINDYKKQFNNFKSLPSSKIKDKMKYYGEVDASIHYNFMKNNNIISFSDMILVHNGFSNRSWFEANKDLYKGNGRLRHENHTICQGPYQTIHYHSYQSNETKNKHLKYSKEVGGELHFEIHIYRNKKMLKTDKPQFEKLSFDDFKLPNDNICAPRGHQEYSKYICLIDFFESINKKKKTRSNYFDHYHSNLLYALSYISGARDFNNQNKKVYFKW